MNPRSVPQDRLSCLSSLSAFDRERQTWQGGGFEPHTRFWSRSLAVGRPLNSKPACPRPRENDSAKTKSYSLPYVRLLAARVAEFLCFHARCAFCFRVCSCGSCNPRMQRMISRMTKTLSKTENLR